MRNLIAGLTCAAVASLYACPALAETWQWFPVKGGAVAYDRDSIKTDITTGAVAAHTVIFYDPPRPAGSARYSFVAERLEFECRSDRHRWSQSAILDIGGAMITSRPDGDWTKIGTEKGSTGLFKRMLCMAQTPPDGKQAKDLAALIVAVRASVPPAAPAVAAPVAQTTLPKTPSPKTPAAPTPATHTPVTQTAATRPAPKDAPKAASANNGKPPPLDLDALVANLAAVSEANATATPPTLPAPVQAPSSKVPAAKAPAARAPAPKAKAPPPQPATKPMPKLRPLTTP